MDAPLSQKSDQQELDKLLKMQFDNEAKIKQLQYKAELLEDEIQKLEKDQSKSHYLSYLQYALDLKLREQDSNQDKIDKLDEEIAALKDELSQLQTKQTTLENNIEINQKDIEETNKAIRAIDRELRRIDNNLRELESQMKKIKLEIESTSVLISKCEEQINNKEINVRVTQQQMQQLAQEIESLKVVNTTLVSTIGQIEQQKQENLGITNNLEQEEEKISLDIKQAEMNQQQEEEKARNVRSKHNEVKNEVNSIKSKIKRLEDSIVAAGLIEKIPILGKVYSLFHDCENKRAEVNKLKSELSTQESKLQKHIEEEEAAKNQIAIFKNQREILLQRRDTIKKNIDKQVAQMVRLVELNDVNEQKKITNEADQQLKANIIRRNELSVQDFEQQIAYLQKQNQQQQEKQSAFQDKHITLEGQKTEVEGRKEIALDKLDVQRGNLEEQRNLLSKNQQSVQDCLQKIFAKEEQSINYKNSQKEFFSRNNIINQAVNKAKEKIIKNQQKKQIFKNDSKQIQKEIARMSNNYNLQNQ